jgi:hypothetical protein
MLSAAPDSIFEPVPVVEGQIIYELSPKAQFVLDTFFGDIAAPMWAYIARKRMRLYIETHQMTIEQALDTVLRTYPTGATEYKEAVDELKANRIEALCYIAGLLGSC